MGVETKRWIAALATGVIMGCSPWLLHLLGLMPDIRPVAWLGVLFLFFIAAVKIAYAPSLSGDGFTYAKQGNDFCLVTLSSVLTAFVTQWAAGDRDLLPGARRILDFISLGQTPIVMNIIGLACIGALAFGGFLLTAAQISVIRMPASGAKEFRAVMCYVIGLFCITCNVAILISK